MKIVIVHEKRGVSVQKQVFDINAFKVITTKTTEDEEMSEMFDGHRCLGILILHCSDCPSYKSVLAVLLRCSM